MSKVKELPYKQGYDACRSGQGTKANPYWEEYDKGGMEWAFHSWLNGWQDARNEHGRKPKESDE